MPVQPASAALAARLPAVHVWAAVLVSDVEGRILMLHTRTGLGWQLPGGVVEGRELPPDAAARAVEEETGQRVLLGSLVGITMESAPAEADAPASLGYVYSCEPLPVEQAMAIALNPAEHDGYRWGTAAELAAEFPEQGAWLAELARAADGGGDPVAVLERGPRTG